LQCCGSSLEYCIKLIRKKTEKDAKLAEKYAKLGKAAKFRSLYDIGGSNRPMFAARFAAGWIE